MQHHHLIWIDVLEFFLFRKLNPKFLIDDVIVRNVLKLPFYLHQIIVVESLPIITRLALPKYSSSTFSNVKPASALIT